jgi:Tfp pilus assembly protein PilF
MVGQGFGREVAGASQTDAPAPAWSQSVAAVSAAANAAAPDQAHRQATRLIALAVTMLDRGDARSALAAASEACHRASHLPQAHYVYGQAWSALGNEARAERAFAGALQLAPRWAEAWVNYGVARYRQGAIEDAKTAMRQALQSVPGHPAASANLGAFMRISGETEAAEVLLRETVAREPDNAAARLNLAADLLQEERSGEALALLEDAAPADADLRVRRHWLLQKSLALLQLGRAGEALEALSAFSSLGPIPPALAPLWHWRHVLLAICEADVTRAREAAGQMEAALGAMGPAAVPEHRVMAHYDLAKFWSGQNDHPRAFANWAAGHALLGPSQPFSRDEHLGFVDANIAAFTRAGFTARGRAGNSDSAPVFIVGMPRSGTTLVEQILAAHAQVHGAGERPALPRAFGVLGGDGDRAEAVRRIASLDTGTLDNAASDYLADLHALAPDKDRIVDKLPANFNYLGLAARMLPAAKFIHCVRDPRDIGLSIFTFRFHGAHGYAHDLGDLGWYISQHDRLMAHWKAVLPNRILTVRLSNWVEDFDGTLKKVLDHLGLPDDPNCARFHEGESRVRTVSRAQVRQPVNARGLGRWRTYAGELAPLIAELEKAGGLDDWRGAESAHDASARPAEISR